MKKITLINHSDSRGGAAVVTLRLAHALRAMGYDARMVVVHNETGDMCVEAVNCPQWRINAAFLAEQLHILRGNGMDRSTMFRVSAASAGLPLHNHPWVKDADALVLNWVNQGMLSFKGLRLLLDRGIPVAWTMHDMWNLTGVCHHAGDCTAFRHSCGNCPQLGKGAGAADLSARVWQEKEKLYRQYPSLRFVAVSSWLEGKCRESGLLRNRHIDVIPNAIPENIPYEPSMSRAQLGLPEHGRLIVMGAARLDDPIKGLTHAVECLNAYIASKDPQDRPVPVFFGALKDPRALDGLSVPYVHLGTVADHERLRQIYAHASVVLSMSAHETLPGTLVEGISAGAVALSTDNGGASDIIEQGATGFILNKDADNLVKEFETLMDKALAMDYSAEGRRARAAAMQARFGWRTIAKKYISLLFPRK